MTRPFLSNIRSTAALLVLLSILLVPGGACQTGPGGDSGDNDNGGSSGDKGVLMGQVWSLDGMPIPGVAVTLNNGLSASTEDHGYYSFTDLDPGDPVVATFRRSGFATTAKALTVEAADAARPACIIMAPAAATVTISADTGALQRSGDSAVTIGAGSLVDGDGHTVTGDVDLTATFLDPSTEEVQAFPGSFDDAQSQGGQDVTIESFGFAIYELAQNGEDINLAPGATAEIEYVLPDNAQDQFEVGDTIPLWEFDEETAGWVERGQGIVGEASDGSGRLAWFATVDHFSAWNADLPIEEKSCVTGRVVSGPEPVIGAQIVATGVSYNGTSQARTDADGMFCVEVKRGSTVTIEVRLNGAAMPVATRTLTAMDIPADCTQGVCADTGDIEVEFDSCVSGRVVDENGLPYPLEYVYVAPGVVTVTNAEGYYCARAPASTVVYVSAANRASLAVATPESGDCSGGGGCAEADLTFTLPGAGDTVGQLNVSKQVVHTGLPGVPKLAAPMASLSISGSFLAFDPELVDSISFSGLSVEVEEIGVCTVRTMTMSLSVDAGTYADYGWGGIGALNPGSSGRATNGFVTVELYPGDPFADFENPYPAAAGMFTPAETDDELLALGFDAGQTFTFTFPGGPDIGAFDADVDVPPDLDVTVPDLADPATTLDLGAALDVVWVAYDPSDNVMVTLTASENPWFDGGDPTVTGPLTTTIVTCEFPDTGGGTIPSTVMARTPASASLITLDVARSREEEVSVRLNRVDGDAVVHVRGSAGVSRVFTDYAIPDPTDPLDDLDLCALVGIICEAGEVCNTETYPFTCVPEN
jgi:hypothetical protein